MKSTFIIVLLVLMNMQPSHAQSDLAGTWTGAIAVQGINLGISVHFAEANGTLTATIDIPMQGAKGVPLQNVKGNPPQVYFELPAGPGLAVFDGQREGGTHIKGTFTQAAAKGTFTLDKAPSEDTAQTTEPAAEGPSESLALETPKGTLYGTMRPPEGEAPYPVALIIAGSGPTDRNGNSAIAGKNNSLKMLAEGLAEGGWASVRYDKRGIGESTAAMIPEAELVFTDLVDDAARWVQHLQADLRFSKVVVIGHSEGSLIGMLAARRMEADAFISVAGPGRRATDVLREQLKAQLPNALMQQSEHLMQTIMEGGRVADVPQPLMALFRPSIQPYLQSWFAFDPADELARFTRPAMIIQGTTDIQITVDDAQRLADAQPDAQLEVVQGMNHVLKSVPADPVQQQQSYSNPDLPLHPALVPAMLAFLTGVN